MTNRQESSQIPVNQNFGDNQQELDRIFSQYNIEHASQEEALVILDKLKEAVLNHDSEVINSVCTMLKEKTDNTSYQPIIESTCNNLFKEINCNSIMINFSNPDERNHPSTYMNIIGEQKGKCSSAIVYVDSGFQGFNEQEIRYLSSELNVLNVDIINSTTNEKIYSGVLDENANSNNHDGWMILIIVVIFVITGVIIGTSISK